MIFMSYVLSTQSNLVLTCVFLVSILGYEPYHILLKCRCLLIKECDDIRHNYHIKKSNRIRDNDRIRHTYVLSYIIGTYLNGKVVGPIVGISNSTNNFICWFGLRIDLFD
jgi:hypothetical protein